MGTGKRDKSEFEECETKILFHNLIYLQEII